MRRLVSLLLIERDASEDESDSRAKGSSAAPGLTPRDAAWIIPDRRVTLVHKVMETLDAFVEPYRAIGQYIDKTYIAGRYLIDFADASAKIDLEAPVVYRFGRAIGDEAMMGFARRWGSR